MQKLICLLSLTATIACTACNNNNQADADGTSAVAEAGEETYALPADVLTTAKPLIGGSLYSHPDFKSVSLVLFDTSQVIQLLDTSDALFFKARINRNHENYTGYISKAILPEQL
ncbi:hypothetical protein H7F15_02520 [Pontibacter sp. Tf4]|uniref:hypothetical protein n=1 Tax=Pontibacter sp. Tf4 TaxID=2761620 RepID=UPI0016243E77|nr:hypothetical protein [Pontibacter sp. Tf4]MBB6609901.1 hypothetical protein [Pontibacter sp. Tf4]